MPKRSRPATIPCETRISPSDLALLFQYLHTEHRIRAATRSEIIRRAIEVLCDSIEAQSSLRRSPVQDAVDILEESGILGTGSTRRDRATKKTIALNAEVSLDTDLSELAREIAAANPSYEENHHEL